MISFTAVKDLLEFIHMELDFTGTVFAKWDGDFMTIIHSRPDLVDKNGFMMRFDSPSDYDPDNVQPLIEQFAAASKAYFNEGVIDGQAQE